MIFIMRRIPRRSFTFGNSGRIFSVEENMLGRFSVVGKDGVSEDFNVTKEPDRYLGHYGQSKEVIRVESVKKVDILWSIDNSGSMGSYQAAIANNFSLFIEDFAKKDVDFKMAIITTDSPVNKDSNNRLSSLELKKNKQNFINDFKSRIQVGVAGSGQERSFEMAKSFVEGNAAWFRDDALFVVIFVSDEREQSPGTVQQYKNVFVKAKGGNGEKARVFSICSICNRFTALSQATNGIVKSIHSSFADISKEFGESIVRNLTNLKTVFFSQHYSCESGKSES